MSKIFNLKPQIKPELKVTAKSSGVSEIIIYGAIGDDFFDDSSVSASDFHKALKELPSNTKEIHLRLNSPGGSVFDGMTIYERLKAHPAKVVVYVDGLAASIASVIALAGDEVYIGEGSFFMLHRPMSGVYGNTSEMERMIDILDKIERQMIAIYAKKTNLTNAEVSKMITDDRWIDSAEAIELGFATALSNIDEDVRVAASAMIDKASWIKSRPKGLETQNQLARKKILEVQNKVKGFLAR